MAIEAIEIAKEKMEKSEQALRRELSHIRAGRANASLLDRVQIEYYGVPTPINQVAQITTPEARVLMITPFDKTTLKDIEHALLASDLGINPMNDGTVIRLVFPQLTEERRKELAKEVKKIAEQGKVSIRHIRRDTMSALKKLEKDNEITEDDLRGLEKDVQDLTDQSIKNMENIAAEKEQELLEV